MLPPPLPPSTVLLQQNPGWLDILTSWSRLTEVILETAVEISAVVVVQVHPCSLVNSTCLHSDRTGIQTQPGHLFIVGVHRINFLDGYRGFDCVIFEM